MTSLVEVKQYNKRLFMAHNPKLIGVILGVKFYENPIYGDERELIAVVGEKCFLTEFFELDDIDNII